MSRMAPPPRAETIASTVKPTGSRLNRRATAPPSSPFARTPSRSRSWMMSGISGGSGTGHLHGIGRTGDEVVHDGVGEEAPPAGEHDPSPDRRAPVDEAVGDESGDRPSSGVGEAVDGQALPQADREEGLLIGPLLGREHLAGGGR